MRQNPSRRYSINDDIDTKAEEKPETEALRRAHEDAQRTLDHHLDVFTDEAEKASRILRFNGIVITIVVSALSLSDDVLSYFALQLFAIGGIIIGFGSLLAIWEQPGRKIEVGPGKFEFETIEEHNMTEQEYLRWVISRGYNDWIDQASRRSREKADYVGMAVRVSALGILFFVGGTIITLA